jgi:hypothetical protein
MDGNGNNDKDHSGNNPTHDGKWGSSPNKLVSKEMQDALKLRRDEQNLFARFKNAAIQKMSREDEENEGGINNLRMSIGNIFLIQLVKISIVTWTPCFFLHSRPCVAAIVQTVDKEQPTRLPSR